MVNNPAAQLDASGYICPQPILMAKRALSKLATGEVLHIICTDPTSQEDFDQFCKQTGHHLIDRQKRNDQFHYAIQKA